ncbi:unnamed protein product, partial [Mesorhabditis spiculigera]
MRLESLLLILCSLLASICAAPMYDDDVEDERPIRMMRRDFVPITTVLTDLKAKGIGGRMRFGKRSAASGARYVVKRGFVYAPY